MPTERERIYAVLAGQNRWSVYEYAMRVSEAIQRGEDPDTVAKEVSTPVLRDKTPHGTVP